MVGVLLQAAELWAASGVLGRSWPWSRDAEDLCRSPAACPGPPVPRGHLPGRNGGPVLPLMCMAPLLSSCWLGTKCQSPEQRDLYAAPSPRGLRLCFLFIPCCWDSMGRNSAPCPTVVTQMSILHRGSRDAPPGRGRSKGSYKEQIVCWGPGSEQDLGGSGQEPT